MINMQKVLHITYYILGRCWFQAGIDRPHQIDKNARQQSQVQFRFPSDRRLL